jgi:hypothetical protein
MEKKKKSLYHCNYANSNKLWGVSGILIHIFDVLRLFIAQSYDELMINF